MLLRAKGEGKGEGSQRKEEAERVVTEERETGQLKMEVRVQKDFHRRDFKAET